jgi:hypothetical protein
MIEGSGVGSRSGSEPLTHGSGYGSWRPKTYRSGTEYATLVINEMKVKQLLNTVNNFDVLYFLIQAQLYYNIPQVPESNFCDLFLSSALA